MLLVISDAQDEADIRQKLVGTRNTLFAVHAVASLAQAFKLIADKSFDTFMIDLAVPDSDGISGLPRLVAAARYAPVIIITSVYDESQALEVVRAGADDYVVKSRMNAAAFERVLCYATERHGVRRQTDLQLALSRVLAESQNLSEASDGILRVLCESLKFDLGAIGRIDNSANLLFHARSWCVPSRKHLQFQAFSQISHFRCGEGLPGRVWQTRVPQWIEDVSECDCFTRIPAATTAGFHGACAIPLGLFQGIFGVMTFFSHR